MLVDMPSLRQNLEDSGAVKIVVWSLALMSRLNREIKS